MELHVIGPDLRFSLPERVAGAPHSLASHFIKHSIVPSALHSLMCQAHVAQDLFLVSK